MTKAATPGPAPDIVAAWRMAAGLTQQQAADLVYVTADAWRRWEDGSGGQRSRTMPYGLFELFCLKTESQSTRKTAKSP